MWSQTDRSPCMPTFPPFGHPLVQDCVHTIVEHYITGGNADFVAHGDHYLATSFSYPVEVVDLIHDPWFGKDSEI